MSFALSATSPATSICSLAISAASPATFTPRSTINARNLRGLMRSKVSDCLRPLAILLMLFLLRCALQLGALTLLLTMPHAHATDAIEIPAPTASPITSLFYAPDGQSLWCVSSDDELTIRGSDERNVRFRGKISRGDTDTSRGTNGGLKVLDGNSFLWCSGWGSLQWFKPPQKGQPLRLRREFDGREALAWKAQLHGQLPERNPRFSINWGLSSLSTVAVSPDEKLVAHSFEVFRGYSMSINGFDNGTVVRVWNLETGKMESEDSQLWNRGHSRGDTPTKLAWTDSQTLTIARGLGVERYTATVGEMVSDWTPLDAPEALERAIILQKPEHEGKSPAEIEALAAAVSEFKFNVGRDKSIALSTDGSQLILWSAERLVTLWNVETGEAQILSDDADFMPVGAQFSPDGATVTAWTCKEIRVWRGGKSGLALPMRPEALIADVALSNDRLAFSAGRKGSWSLMLPPQKIWDEAMTWDARPVRFDNLELSPAL